jgi:excisionase family DNA binding protein
MTIYRLIEHGELPYKRLGLLYRIPAEAIRALLGEST